MAKSSRSRRLGALLGRLALLGIFSASFMGSSAQAQTHVDGVLKVGAYGGAFTAAQKKYIGEQFTAHTGMRVQYVDGNGSDFLAQLIASKGRKPPLDVVYLEKDVRDSAKNSGIFAKLDPSVVTNLQYLYPQAKDPDGYGPGMAFYSVGIVYNPGKFKAAGIAAPTSWNDLWNPKLAGHIALPDLTTSYGREFLIAAARLKGGSEQNPMPGLQAIGQIKARLYFSSSTQLASQLQSGDVWAAPWINARAWGMIDKGAPLRYVIPKEGGIGNMDTIDVVAGTDHMKQAQLYVNMVLGPLGQLGNATDNPLGPTNKLLAPILKQYPQMAQRFPSSPQDLQKLYLVNWTAYLPNRDKVINEWNHMIASK